MIKKFIDKLLGKTPAGAKSVLGKRVELARGRAPHRPRVARRQRGQVVQTFEGRGLRGLRGRRCRARPAARRMRPKDFDVATNATPEQVKALFRRAFIIGPALPHRPRGLRARPRARGDRGLDLPRHPGRPTPSRCRATRRLRAPSLPASRTSSMPRAACCATTSGAADRGRRPARLHRQRDVLRPADRDAGRLPPRREGRRQAPAAHDRRPGDALPRGPGAHRARGCASPPSSASRSRPRRARPSSRCRPCSRTSRRRACSTR